MKLPAIELTTVFSAAAVATAPCLPIKLLRSLYSPVLFSRGFFTKTFFCGICLVMTSFFAQNFF